ncbi:MAG: DUF423 domain-containing protein [Flavobacteriaceae bacterium]|nr:DUF423 domain-containing protein [Flavobacteriaceae bacterium]
MNKKILGTAAFLGMFSVILGAYGAHGLEKIIDSESVKNFNTAVEYQMYHALLLMMVGLTNLLSAKTKQIILCLVVLGVLFFSGSIYGLSTNELSSFDFKTIAFITPIGGLLLILSWALLFIKFIQLKKNNL